jgi:hypothetical protein
MAKALADLSAAELKKRHKTASARSSKFVHEMIAAGRGNERPSNFKDKSDPLSVNLKQAYADEREINDEIERRKRYHGTMKPIRPHRWL